MKSGKKIKRGLTVLLAAAMCAALWPSAAFAAEETSQISADEESLSAGESVAEFLWIRHPFR